jgi:hypothetical protein
MHLTYLLNVIFLASVVGASPARRRLKSSAFAVPGNATYDYVGKFNSPFSPVQQVS